FNRGEELWNQSFQSDLLWYEVVGEFFFKPLGLFNPISGTKATEPEEQAYFSFDSKTVADIKARNPALANKHFFCVREAAQGVSKRPFLIANATFMGPQGVPNRPTLYAGLEMTPLYVGAPNIFKIDYPTRTPHLVRIVRLGGGFLETFAFGTVAPAKLPSLCPPSTASSSQDGSSCVGLTPPKRHFNMVEASALASAFYAQLLASYLNDTSFTMVRDVWPVSKTPLQPAGGPLPTEKDYFIGDGGLLENYGVISLLLRGVEKIVVFVNTSTILDIHYNGTTAPEASQVDSLLPQLFGQALADGTNPNSLDHVFELKKGTVGGSSYDGFAEVVQGLVAAKKRDKAGPGQWAGVVSQNRLRTVPNDNWGLPGGREVEVLWVYLDRVNQWEKLLPSTPDPKPAHDFARPWTFKKYIEYGNGLGSENPFGTHYGPVAYFPTYSLAYENNDLEPDFQLTPFQVNLMSNLTWWVVDENAAMLKQWLS
ncbi:MAG: hypothetical protein K0U98_08800, partial [Deltaproteobacteria bacterium]|nr:hypothetical protein [Deltaproteobacteria bacterium]